MSPSNGILDTFLVILLSMSPARTKVCPSASCSPGPVRAGRHDGKLSPDEELPHVAVSHDEVWLRQGLDRSLVMKDPKHSSEFRDRTGCDNEELRQVADSAVEGIPARA